MLLLRHWAQFIQGFILAPLLCALCVPLDASPASLPDRALHFEANGGQTDSRVQFLARTEGGTFFLTSTEAVLSAPGLVLRTRAVGSDPSAQVTGEDKQPSSIRYYRHGRSTSANSYSRVRYHSVYPGIDLVYYGNGRELEYDFQVAPGADPNCIRLSFDGVQRVSIDSEGDLILETSAGLVRERAPVIFQKDQQGGCELVAGGYVLMALNEVGFHIAEYDRSRELIIDPVIVYSSYLSGANTDVATDMKVDASGNVYVVGSTTSPDFPGAPAGQFKGNRDMFVTKLSPDGKTILYTTYLGEGESGGDEATAIVLDAAGNAYITGVISKFMLLGDATYAVVAKFNRDGSLVFFNRVTETEGIAHEVVNDMAVDQRGNIYLAGWTDLDTIPIVNGFQSTPVSLGFGSGFLVQLDPRAEKILYSTYIGSMGFSRANSVAVDADGYAYVTGTSSEIPTTRDSFQPNLAGEGDAYVMKLDPRRSGLDAIVYSTYLGGHDEDSGKVIRVDAQGQAWVAGYTKSNDVVPPEYPVTPNAFQKHLGFTLWSTAHCYGGVYVAFCSDAFLTGLSADGRALIYSTYLGGDGPDLVHAMALDPSNGRVYLTGQACGFFPVTEDATQAVSANCKGAFMAIIDPIETGGLVFSTHLAGSALDLGTAIARAPSGDIWVTGYTSSTDFPLVDPLMTLGGGNGNSVFVTRFSFGTASSASPLRISLGAGKVTLTWSGGTLQEADNPAGVFQTVPSATSPYLIPATGPAKFYRVR